MSSILSRLVSFMYYTQQLDLIFEQTVYIWFSKFFRQDKTPITEEELIFLAIKNPKHFSKIYDLYHHKIFTYIFRRVGDLDLAADICSETFVKAFSNLHKYQFKGFSFSSWLYKITTNEINMYFRKNQTETRHVAIYSKTIDLLTEIDEETSMEEKLVQLQNALTFLEQVEVQLLEWRFYEELSFKEIGYLLDISEDNAKIRTYRVIEKIKKSLFKPKRK